MTTIRRTPLHAFHEGHGARFVPFAGWEMPVQYTSILAEHTAVREAAGLFDVSHMGEATVTGPDAEAYLNHLLTNDVSKLVDGKGLYTVMCQDDGGVVDDLIVFKRADDDYFLCINAANTAKDIAWMQDQTADFNEVTVTDVSADYALLAIQGPKAAMILQALTPTDLSGVGRFRSVDLEVAGVPVYATRTGYTGEDGFELYIAPDQATQVADALLAAGKGDGLQLVGLGARDSLRLEAGLPLYGHELSDVITPLQANLGWVVKLKKDADFVGKEALAAEKAAGPAHKVVYYRLPGRRIAREGAAVLVDDREVGRVLSGSLSPLLGRAIGSALVAADAAGAPLAVELGRQRFPLEVKSPPLHKD